MTDPRARTLKLGFVVAWPLLAAAAAALLPFGLVLALIIFAAAIWVLAADRGLPRKTKTLTICCWTICVALFSYALIAFGKLVETADLSLETPTWTRGMTVAVILALVLYVVAGVLVITASRNRTRTHTAAGARAYAGNG